jgi:hypothetical protein
MRVIYPADIYGYPVIGIAQEFWEQHNRAFKEGRERFVRNILATRYPNQPDKKTLTADEMSLFYSNFLNER